MGVYGNFKPINSPHLYDTSYGLPSVWFTLWGPQGVGSADVASVVSGVAPATRSAGCIWTSGPSGACLSVNGTSGYAQTSITPAIQSALVGGSSYSVSLMVNISSTSMGACVSKMGLPFSGVAIGIGGTQFDNAGNNLLILSENVAWIPTTVPLGTGWKSIEAVFPPASVGGTISVYLNGQLAASPSIAGYTFPASGTITVGADTNNSSNTGAPGRFFAGLIDNPRVFLYARSAQQILADFNDPYARLRPFDRGEILPFVPVASSLWPGWFTNPAMSTFDALGL